MPDVKSVKRDERFPLTQAQVALIQVNLRRIADETATDFSDLFPEYKVAVDSLPLIAPVLKCQPEMRNLILDWVEWMGIGIDVKQWR